MEALKIEGLSKNFGALEVLRDVSLTVKTGECVAIIGPNGAGKTTLLNVVSGELVPTAGRIYILGQEVTRIPTHRRVHTGLSRSFQLTRVFPNLTILQNILLALHGIRPSCYQMFRPTIAYNNLVAKAQKLLELINLWGKRNELACAISYGEQRKMEIALSLASEPKLLLLDEPSAGLDIGEIPDFVKTMKTLVKDITLVFSAHDMEVVFGLANRVVVLYYGKFIADGTPKEIKANPTVREIYLGVEEGDTRARVR
jgi:branched-chain amino acid transport system ATP-binding protein